MAEPTKPLSFGVIFWYDKYMNTNPNAKRILCYGDSITWGRIPGDDNAARYSINKRWPGILQNLLGNEYEVIEEGLNGRTTNLESPLKAGKNGAVYLFSCLEAHKPLDVIILSLGKNNLKSMYNATPESICNGIGTCLQIISREGKTASGETPKMIIVSPPIIEEKERMRFGKKEVDFLGANEKSKKLGEMYLNIAEKHNIEYLDLAEYVKVSEIDGVHLDKNEHHKIAEILHQKVIKLLSTCDDVGRIEI